MQAIAAPKSHADTTAMKFLGYGKYDAAMNMAIDEAMALRSAATNESFIRFYDFTRPSVILASNDDPKCLRQENLGGIDVTRRKSGGRPIFIDSNILSYSLSVPLGNDTEWASSLKDVHQRFGRLTADAIARIAGIDGSLLQLPRTSSIRYNGNPIAGHGQYLVPGRFLLYHGVIVVAPWDIERLSKAINISDHDLHRIEMLPCVVDFINEPIDVSALKDHLVEDVLLSLSAGKFASANGESSEILAGARQLRQEVYANRDWVFREDAQRVHNVPFCILWEENG